MSIDQPKKETDPEKIRRLMKEIAERTSELERLILGDPRKGVHIPAIPPDHY